jgi:ring-1,2-phenylacetyl-CoA epoxidase subunit PaaC
MLEEDIALANMAQDELGHAMQWLELRKGLDASDPDKLAYFRDASDFRNTQLVELPKGDWAFTMLRQYLFDTYEAIWLSNAQTSSYQPLAETAAKLLREERFHLSHSHVWVERLGLGTEESQTRMQAALDTLWPYAHQLFVPLPDEGLLIAKGIAPDIMALKNPWLERTSTHLKDSSLRVPEETGFVPHSRKQHSEHLWSLLAEMQSTAHWDSEAELW